MQELKLSLRWFPFSVSRFSCFTRKCQIVLNFSINKKPWGLLTADLLSQREETDLLSLAVSLESNLMGRLPNMLCDTRLVWSGSISLYSVPLNLTVKFAATLVTFLRKLHHKSCYLLIKVVGCTLSLRVITRGTGVKTKFTELLEISCKEVKGAKMKKTETKKKQKNRKHSRLRDQLKRKQEKNLGRKEACYLGAKPLYTTL